MVIVDRISKSPSGDGNAGVPRRFRFALWSALASFAAITAIAVLSSILVSSRVQDHQLAHDAKISTEYVNSIVRIVGAASYFDGQAYNPKAPEMEAFFVQLSGLPEVLRANVYGLDRSVLWSSDADLVGVRFEDDDMLDAAFRGESFPEINQVSSDGEDGHHEFPANVTQFIETYVPVWSADGAKVVGAVEIYRSPASLFNEIASVRRTIWLGSLASALVLFATLVGLVFIVKRILADQENRVVETEKFAVVGEMTSAVAHGLRNPLASIRSSAELALDDDLPESARQPLTDIVSQAERLETWIRSFLTQAREMPGTSPPFFLDDVIRDCLEGFAQQAQSRNIVLTFVPDGYSPLVRIKKSELSQVLNTLISNSVEAIGKDGEIAIARAVTDTGSVKVTVEDNGPGIAPEMASKLFRPFATGKNSGLGVGLSLAKRIVDRCGGTIELANRQKRGACVTLSLPAAGGA